METDLPVSAWQFGQLLALEGPAPRVAITAPPVLLHHQSRRWSNWLNAKSSLWPIKLSAKTRRRQQLQKSLKKWGGVALLSIGTKITIRIKRDKCSWIWFSQSVCQSRRECMGFMWKRGSCLYKDGIVVMNRKINLNWIWMKWNFLKADKALTFCLLDRYTHNKLFSWTR